jgi:hypothetical protein
MAEVRESYPSTEDGSGVGVPLSNAVDTVTAASGKNGSIGFAFKNSSGAVVLPALNVSGQILVTPEVGTKKFATGALAPGSGTMVDITGATITLTATKVSTDVVVTVSCYRDALFNLVQIDDATTTILARFRVGPGQFSYVWTGNKKFVTAGAAGTQTLKVQGQNQNTLSEMDAEISLIELP